jgi:chlorite dismutase
MTPQKEPLHRQVVGFTFYKVAPEWRRLSLQEREDQRREFADTLRKWQVPETMKVLTYSTVGTRAECHFLLWRICYSLECLQEMSADLLRTRLAGYLETPYSYLSMTRRSSYFIGAEIPDRHDIVRGVIKPGGHKYLFVYPMVRTRAWYVLPFEERQRMMNEIIAAGREFPRVHLNVTYSFGLDDNEFVVAIETDYPEDAIERVMRFRESDASPYTLRDTPTFACVQMPVNDMLERIG